MKIEHARRNVRLHQKGQDMWWRNGWGGRGDRAERRVVKRRLVRARRILDRALSNFDRDLDSA